MKRRRHPISSRNAFQGRAPEKAERRELVIDSIGAQGDGVAGAIFTPLTLPGERILVDVEGERGHLVEVLEASDERTEPPCAHFGVCGGCALQHWAAAPYGAWKRDQIRLALGRVHIETDILPSWTVSPGSRRRIALHARRRDRAVVLGFKERRSWQVTAIGRCAVADPALSAALPALTALAEPFLEHPASAPCLHVTLTLTGLDVEVSGVERKAGGLSADARQRAAEAAARADLARVSMAGEILYQARTPMVRAGRATIALPAGAFLQASAEAETAMAAFIVEAAGGARRIADLFCGVGAFTFPLAEVAQVVALDRSAPAIEALMSATGGAGGLKAITAQARDLDRRPLGAPELKGIDAVVFDPPRAGAFAQAQQIALSDCPRAIAVSCNPATFARDARVLVDGGFDLIRVLPVDQFLWSPHCELIGVFTR